MTTEQLRQLNGASRIPQRRIGTHEPYDGRNGNQHDQPGRNGQLTTAFANGNADTMIYWLGWALLGLGLAGLVMPGQATQVIGIRNRNNHRTLIRAAGLRKLVSGVGLLAQPDADALEKIRVGGEMIDLALLGLAFNTRRAQRGKVALALATAVGITALDFLYRRQRHDQRSNSPADLYTAAVDQATQSVGASPTAITIERTITIGRSADDLYHLWRAPQTLPQIMGHFATVRPMDMERAHWRIDGPLGVNLVWETAIIDAQRGAFVHWASLPNATLRNDGLVQFYRAPGEWGTVVALCLAFDPPGGVLGNLLTKLFAIGPEMIVQQTLRRFKSLAETGEIPTTKGQPAARKQGRE